MTFAFIFAALLWLGFGLYTGRGYFAWVGALVLCFAAWITCYGTLTVGSIAFAISGAALATVFGVPSIRQKLISAPVMIKVRRILPVVGETERIALEAGSVGWDGELFSGNPDWKQLLDFAPLPLSKKEQEFLDGPVEELCRMIDDWEVSQLRDLPADAWAYLKKHGFFGMIMSVVLGAAA